MKVEKLKADRKDFERIFRLYYGKVRNFISILVHSESDAEDIAQEVFIRLWEKKVPIRDIRSLDSYLYILSRNAALDHIRKDRNFSEPVVLAVIISSGVEPDDAFLAMVLLFLIRMFVSTLPEKRRRIFEMSRYDGISNEDIAKSLGISRKTVENQIHLSLSELKKMLSLFVFLGTTCNF